MFTHARSSEGEAWQKILSETDSLANQAELVSESLLADVTERLKTIAKDKKANRQRLLTDLVRFQVRGAVYCIHTNLMQYNII